MIQEAVDWQTLVYKNEKQKKYQNPQANEGQEKIQDLYKSALRTEQLEMQDKRKKYDQFNTLVSVVDKFLFNEFSVSQLCKLKLDFLALLILKKDSM